MPTGLTPEQRSLRARLGALSLHATRDPRETTARARATFLAKFVDLVDPERSLPEAERLRRAEYARSAHFARMALASSKKRSGKKTAARAGDLTADETEAEETTNGSGQQLQPA